MRGYAKGGVVVPTEKDPDRVVAWVHEGYGLVGPRVAKRYGRKFLDQLNIAPKEK